MTTQEQKRLRYRAASDQLWAGFANNVSDLTQIADAGPDGSECDTHLIKAVFHLVLGDIILRDEEAKVENDG